MESKYSRFLNYDWANSEEWKIYSNNIFPIPQGNRIDHYKKKYYKLKVDQDFDVHYSPNQNYQANQSPNSSQRNHINPPSSPTPQLIIESLLALLFIIIFYFSDFSLKLSIALFSIRIVSVNGFPKWTIDYLNAVLFNSEDFHLIIYSFILMLKYTTLLLYPPLLVHIVLRLIINVKKMNIEQLKPYRKYINYVLSMRKYIIFYLHLYQLLLCLLLFATIFTGLNSILYLVIYWQFIKFSHCVSSSFQQTTNYINVQINRIKESNAIPNGFKIVIEKIQSAFTYVGTTNLQNTILICRIF